MKKQIGLWLATVAVAIVPLSTMAESWQMGDMYGPRMPDRWYKFESYVVDYRNQGTVAKGQPRRYAFAVRRNRDGSDVWIDQLIARCATWTMQGKVRVHNSHAAPIPSIFIKHYSDKMVPAPQGHGVMVPELVDQILLSDVNIERTSLIGDGSYKSGSEVLSLTFTRAIYMDGHGKVKRDDNWSRH